MMWSCTVRAGEADGELECIVLQKEECYLGVSFYKIVCF